MVNKMIPSKRLKSNLQTLKKNLHRVFSDDIIHKTLPKSNPYGGVFDYGIDSKCVSSDQMFIFTPKNNSSSKESQFSFAIVFDYIGKEEEEMTAMVNIKPYVKLNLWDDNLSKIKNDLNQKIVSSKIMTINDFREKLNLLNKMTNGFSESSSSNDELLKQTINLVKEIFLINNEETEKEIEEYVASSQKKANEQIIIYDEKLLQTKKEFDSSTRKLNLAKGKVNKSIINSEEYIELKKLEDRKKFLEKEIEKKTNELNIKYKIKELEDEENQKKYEYSKDLKNKQSFINKFLIKLPVYIANRIKFK